ncbi:MULTISPECIES: LacI family DNA-binding transcriptional regulator [unclassified Rhizobium]|uniref:LacI family DNA-binding transcriptional regulator n=1 Tax=unclassified Rhizobium TaxID=2613769 RepID=UPI0007015A94|nr:MULTISPECIES: LacI family DNA-binding transcriptional regulator [unclassified Rhizobium]KQV41426.1 LacI family transcriptional regulator [Rhizobium sp. Root1212]KRD37060.1 LacI family transcriptional regulator [Rhizobium sp. Root268]
MKAARPNLSELARHLGVSIATASNALSGKGRLSPELAQRIRETANQMGYVPSQAGRALRTGRSGVLGLVLPDIGNPLYPEIAQEIERVATGAGYGVLIANSRDDISAQDKAIFQLVERGVDGIVIVPRRGTKVPETRCPIAIIDTPKTPRNTVSGDHFDGGAQVARHLTALGHTRILLIGDDPSSNVQNTRINGMRSELSDAQTVETIWIVEIEAKHGKGCALDLAAWRARGFTAFACVSDPHALRALTELQSAGIAIPAEATVTGFDNLQWSSFISPPLTTVKMNMPEIARLAIDALVTAIKDRDASDDTPSPPVTARKASVPMELVIRRSSGPAPEAQP